jgi:hypothetical protein
MLVKNCRKVEKITLHASFEENGSSIPSRELNDSSTGPGLITSTIFSHMQPFSTCTPLALKEISLQKISLRYAASTYCKLIDFRSVKTIKIINCPGADALFAKLSKSTKLPEKLETLEFKHDDNTENDGLGALDGFLCLVSGIRELAIDLTCAKSLPAAMGITRHGKTLTQLTVHACRNLDDCDDELVYDYSSFSQICTDCPLLEQVSVAFPPVSLIRSKQDSFINFEVSISHVHASDGTAFGARLPLKGDQAYVVAVASDVRTTLNVHPPRKLKRLAAIHCRGCTCCKRHGDGLHVP